jgi:hypothetical protein
MEYYVDGLQLERAAYPTAWRLPSSTMLVMSDRESDYPDIPILADTLVCGTNEGDQPNFTAATYLDVEDWKRKTVRYTDPLYELGTQQSKELRNDGAPVPAAGNLYRLLATWLRRAVRSWRGSCRATQHGFVLAPGDLFLLKSMLFSSSRVVMVEDIQDEKDGTLTISFCEWSADDFVAVPYLAQAIVATTTA